MDQIPTAERLQQLTDSFRRTPELAFVELGHCLLALGRPKDAANIGTQGLQLAPENLLGHLMTGIAYSQLHRWEEAQARLLKVVKTDRNNGQGFRLLGEVLMRRDDYERALPVLQHAQNLNPSDPMVLSLLRRARDRMPLDPPAPIPLPMQPIQGSELDFEEEVPTNIVSSLPPDLAALVAVPAPAPAVPRAMPPTEGIPATVMGAALDPIAGTAMNSSPAAMPSPRPTAQQTAQNTILGSPAVRPRVMPVEKTKDAAREGLHRSAAVGEQYLNQLLMGGLLDVPNVRVSQANYDISPGKRWGRSGMRLFVYLFVILLAGTAGSGVWYWYSGRQQTADVNRYLVAAKELIQTADRGDLAAATEEIKLALARDTSDVYTLAVLAQSTGLAAFLYGEYSPEEVQRAVSAVEKSVSSPGDLGYRELLIARSAMGLAEIPALAQGQEERLTSVRNALLSWLEQSPDDHMVRWLLARTYLIAGDRRGALAELEKSHAGGKGAVMATIDLGNFQLDEGDHVAALKLYNDALEQAPNHMMAFVGRSIAKSERRVDIADAKADISIGLAKAQGPYLVAWKELALAGTESAQQDFESFNSALNKSVGPTEPRFLARVALARIQQGRIVDAAELRGQIRWYSADPQLNPIVLALDVELLMARGLTSEALGILGDMPGTRAAYLRGRALFYLRRPADALKAFTVALADSSKDVELQAWAEAARMMSSRGDVRRNADKELDSLGRNAKTKTARFVHGQALIVSGKAGAGKDKLKLSVKDISDASPNPLAYRSYLALAQIEFSKGNSKQALEYLGKSAKKNPGFLPTRDLMGQVLVDSNPKQAMENLRDVLDAGVASVGAELAYARGLMKTGGSKSVAEKAIRRAKDRGASNSSLKRAILEVDERLLDTLGVK